MATLTMTIVSPIKFDAPIKFDSPYENHPRCATPPTELELRHEALRNRFRGQDIVVPNFYDLMPGWKPEVNKVYNKELRDKTNNWLFDRIASTPKHRKWIEGVDPLFLNACFYPDVGEEACYQMALYTGWLYLWDDEIDCGTLAKDTLGTKRVHAETHTAMSYTLGPARFSGPPPKMSRIMQAYCDVVTTIQASCSESTQIRILDELRQYVDAVVNMQAKYKEDLPKFREFNTSRRHTAAVGINIGLLEYSYDLDLPDSFFEHEAVKIIIDKTCFLIQNINDIASLAKEINDVGGQLDNVVAVLVYHQGLTPQSAIDFTSQLISDDYTAFEAAKTRVPIPKDNPKLAQDIRTWIKGCEDIVIGMTYWTYNCKRYFKNPEYIRDTGAIKVYIP